MLVTGTSSGIGRAAVARLAVSGFHVFACAPALLLSSARTATHVGSRRGHRSVRKDKDAAALQKMADELECRDRIPPVMMEVPDRTGLSHGRDVCRMAKPVRVRAFR